MVQVVGERRDVLGAIGKGIGQSLSTSLSEQLPKEVERSRLAYGLEQLGKEKGLTQFQRFSKLATQPGVTPQMVQSGTDLLRQEAYLDALKNQYEGQGEQKQGKGGYTPTQDEINSPIKGEIPTLATPEATQESYKTYRPPTEQEERRDAYENFQKNPARYNYDFENALSERKAITTRNQEIQQSLQSQEKTAVGKEEQVKKALEDEKNKLSLNSIPPKAYQKFEEKILNSILSKKEGGEGLTQEQAIKKYSKELDQANRNYLDLGSLSTWSPQDFDRQTKALQKDFSSRGEQQLMMDQLIADYGISPAYAAHRAFPIETFVPDVKLKKISNMPYQELNNLDYERLRKDMGTKGSPLSIAYDIEQKGHNPRGWLEYLDKNRDNLEVWQADQLTKPTNILNLKDLWLRAWEK